LLNVELENRRHKAPASAIIFIAVPQYLYRFQSGIGDPVGVRYANTFCTHTKILYGNGGIRSGRGESGSVTKTPPDHHVTQ